MVSALLVPPWSWLAAGSVVAAQVPPGVGARQPVPAAGSYYKITAVWRASSVVVPLWLVRTILQLHAARRALADEAVVRERVRIDAEVRRTLGTALDAIVSRGRRAGTALSLDRRDPQSRSSCAHWSTARGGRWVTRAGSSGGYQQGSLRSEIDTAAGLLDAAACARGWCSPPGPCPTPSTPAPGRAAGGDGPGAARRHGPRLRHHGVARRRSRAPRRAPRRRAVRHAR